ncbi:MAG: triphosphoribosyl-dephospho-CoA synthase [Alistipes senegalensis]|nr:triphosphoribosyl-dephospho-CoA synthase [Alistipes senegalensis]
MQALAQMDAAGARALASQLAGKAVCALLEEARLSPKPGLVDARGRGSHADMDLPLLEASALSLEPFFYEMALAGCSCMPEGALRRKIGAIGREGEKAMMEVTGGVNTHRGAIWALGLLVTASAMHGGAATSGAAAKTAARLARLDDRGCLPGFSKGRYATGRYGVPGAREEAQCGFPHVTGLALPFLARSRKAGVGEEAARIDALLAVMTSLTDTCVLFRGGRAALNAMHEGARQVLLCGGAGSRKGKKALATLEAAMLSAGVSPGGAADLLAAALFLDGTAIQ